MLVAPGFYIALSVLLHAFRRNPLLAAALAVYGSVYKRARGIVDDRYCLPNTQLTRSVWSVSVLCIAVLIHRLVLGPVYRLRQTAL